MKTNLTKKLIFMVVIHKNTYFQNGVTAIFLIHRILAVLLNVLKQVKDRIFDDKLHN